MFPMMKTFRCDACFCLFPFAVSFTLIVSFLGYCLGGRFGEWGIKVNCDDSISRLGF